jgi:hypothetical protein
LDENMVLQVCAPDPEDIDERNGDPEVNSLTLEKGSCLLIPKGMWHRFRASIEPVTLLEIGFGLYDQVYDIERREDDYDRVGMDGSV